MKLFVANPIYDSVFKYLIEDERIAKILLSALLKKEVLKVEPRPHEYSNITRNNISMFRIDFGATVREADGSERLVLIELQKTWLETETLRFRQYLSTQEGCCTQGHQHSCGCHHHHHHHHHHGHGEEGNLRRQVALIALTVIMRAGFSFTAHRRNEQLIQCRSQYVDRKSVV